MKKEAFALMMVVLVALALAAGFGSATYTARNTTTTTTAMQTTTGTVLATYSTVSTVTATSVRTQTTVQTSTATSVVTKTSVETNTILTSSIASGTTTTSTIGENQTFFNAGSNRNYFYMDNGTRIQNATFTMALAGQLVGTTPPTEVSGGNWSFQVNGYAPPGFEAAYLQWVVAYSQTSPRSANLIFEAEYYAVSDARVLLDSVGTGLNPNVLAAGTQISIGVVTNSTGNVVASNLMVTELNGTAAYKTILDFKPYSSVDPPVVGFEPSLIGYCCGGHATFTQADGVFLAHAQTPMSWTANFPGVYPWVQYKHIGTVETSNIRYWLPQEDSTTIVQEFSE
jgi:hypothetical protein